MAKNISLLGADYPDVPAVQLPQTGGGTATYYDINVIDNLNSDSSTDALSAKQGKQLNNNKVGINEVANLQAVELSPASSTAGHGGYIDFHFNGSSADYTSRIIENSSGDISINGISIAGLNSNKVSTTVIHEKIGELYICQQGNTVTINGYMSGLSLSTSDTLVGTLPNTIGKPQTTIRTICAVGDAAYVAGNIGYLNIGTNGKIYVQTKSGTASVFYVSCAYTVW